MLEGNFSLSPAMTERMVHMAVGTKVNGDRSPLARLTDREIEIFEMIGQGLTSRQIARHLELSPKTVETPSRTHQGKTRTEKRHGADQARRAICVGGPLNGTFGDKRNRMRSTIPRSIALMT